MATLSSAPRINSHAIVAARLPIFLWQAKSGRAMEQTLDQAARAGRGELDTGLMESLGQDMEAALAARKEAEQIA